MKKTIAVLHNAINHGTIDELDVLAQRDLVVNACRDLGHRVLVFESLRDPMDVIKSIWNEDVLAVFNLVESTWDKGELLYVVPALLNALRLPYTGVPVEALFLTTQKILAKDMMRCAGLPTPDHVELNEIDRLDPAKSYICKPIWEEASVGIGNDPVFTSNNKEKLKWLNCLSPRHYFVEEFIEGREFGVSMLGGKKGVEILPIAEMLFDEYFNDKPKILGYKAKWVEDSEEYKQTRRAFDTLASEPELKEKIETICLKIWDLFKLKGYARVDLRVDRFGEPFILEVNGNPCISPDSGYMAAAEEAGYNAKTVIKRILEDVN